VADERVADDQAGDEQTADEQATDDPGFDDWAPHHRHCHDQVPDDETGDRRALDDQATDGSNAGVSACCPDGSPSRHADQAGHAVAFLYDACE
jgi:hypothetical protein